MDRIKYCYCLVVVLLFSISLVAQAGEVDVVPILSGRTIDSTSSLSPYHTIGEWEGSTTVTWAKYELPSLASGEELVAVLININVTAQANFPYTPEINVTYSSDDSWDATTINSLWPCVESETVGNRYASDTGYMAYGLASSNITDFLSQAGEGLGATLTVRLSNNASGVRGCLIEVPTLTVITQEVNPMGLSRGHQILLERGLQIQAQMFNGPFDLELWADSNFTTMNFQWGIDPNVMGPAPGMAWGRWAGDSALLSYELPYAENFISYQFRDEQNIAQQVELDDAKNILAAWRIAYPDTLGFTNQNENGSTSWTETALGDYVAYAEPDMIMFDRYPFDDSAPDITTWYERLQKYRNVGNEPNTPIPYGTYMQTQLQSGHTPSESEIRLNWFSAWTFGYKFVSAFVYNSPECCGVTPLMFTGNGDANPTAKFYEVAETNAQSLNLGDALVRLQNVDVRMVANQHGRPSNVDAWDASADPYTTAIVATNLGSVNSGNAGDVLIGYFKVLHEDLDGDAYADELYFMVLNGLTGPYASAADTQQQIEITFDFGTSGVTELQRVSRDTGAVEIVPLTHVSGSVYKLTVTLDGGTADLFKFNTGAPFVNGPTACGLPGTTYLPCDISGADGQPDCYVDELDLAKLADRWLDVYPAVSREISISASSTVSVPRQSDGWPRPEAFAADTVAVGLVGWMGFSDAYQQFQIPDLLPGEVIMSAEVNIKVSSQYSATYNAGVMVGYTANDEWPAYGWGSPAGDWWNGGDWQNLVPASDWYDNRYPSDSGQTPYGWIATDITDYFSKSGEGQGELLSLVYAYTGSGDRGCYCGVGGVDIPYITLYTQIDGIDRSADISGPNGEADLAVDLYDLAIMSSQWLDCSDPANVGCSY